jgi:pimeloyl-ACP methyl ester carboxylesterase
MGLGAKVRSMTERTVTAGGWKFRVLDEGSPSDRAVLLLHGFPESAEEWRAQLGFLARAGFRAIAPDQRGYSAGARPEGVAAYGIDLLVGDALAICDSLDIKRFDLVGHDWGAIVAWMLAAHHPSRVRSFTAVSVPHPEAFADAYASLDSNQREMSSYIDVFRAEGDAGEKMLAGEDGAGLRQLFEQQGLSPEAVAGHAAIHEQPEALTAAMNWYRATHPTMMRGVPRVSIPTLFVWGTLDPAISRDAAEGCAQYVTGPYRFEVLESVGHWIPELEAETFNRILLEHLTAH